MDGAGRNGQALTWAQTDDFPRRELLRRAIDLDGEGIIGPAAIRSGFRQLDKDVAAMAADNVLAFGSVEVCGSALVFGIDKEFFRIGLVFQICRLETDSLRFLNRRRAEKVLLVPKCSPL